MGQIQLDVKKDYLPLDEPMVKETFHKAQYLINELHSNNHIDDMTRKWLSQTPNPPRIPVFYTLTKIHKLTPVGRPIISGCDGPTEQIFSFIDYILQPIAKSRESYLKDTKDFHREDNNPSKCHNSFFGCDKPVHQHTSRRGNWNRMQGIWQILQKRYSNTHPHTQRNDQTFTSGEFLPIQWKRLPANSWNHNGH